MLKDHCLPIILCNEPSFLPEAPPPSLCSTPLPTPCSSDQSDHSDHFNQPNQINQPKLIYESVYRSLSNLIEEDPLLIISQQDRFKTVISHQLQSNKLLIEDQYQGSLVSLARLYIHLENNFNSQDYLLICPGTLIWTQELTNKLEIHLAEVNGSDETHQTPLLLENHNSSLTLLKLQDLQDLLVEQELELFNDLLLEKEKISSERHEDFWDALRNFPSTQIKPLDLDQPLINLARLESWIVLFGRWEIPGICLIDLNEYQRDVYIPPYSLIKFKSDQPHRQEHPLLIFITPQRIYFLQL